MSEISLAAVNFLCDYRCHPKYLTKTFFFFTFNSETMKSISRIILAAAIFLTASGIYGQELSRKSKIPKWVSEKGFWQIETNIHTPNKNIVYFYNNDRTLIYKENLDGVVLNLEKKRVKMRLKRALETAILAWNTDHLYRNDQQWISMFFKN